MKTHEVNLFLWDPLVQSGVLVVEGLPVLKTEDEAKARRLMEEETFTKLSLRHYDMKT